MTFINNETSTLAGSESVVGGAQGAAITSAATITVTDFVHTVSGAATITTINGGIANGLYCLIPDTGATWTLATGGNIDRAVTPRVGVPVFLILDGTTWRIAEGSGLTANAVLRSGGSQPLTADLDLGGTYTVSSLNSMPVLNMESAGMIGNDSFDNTDALNALIAQIPAGGAILVCGPGIFRARGPFTLPYGTSIIGAGMVATKFRNMADADFWYSLYPGTQGLVFRDFSIYDGFGAGRTQGAGIHLDGGAGTAYTEITNVLVSTHIYGFRIRRGLLSVIRASRASACSRWGFLFEEATTSLTIQNTFASACGTSGDLTTGGYYFQGLAAHNGTRYSTLMGTAADQNKGCGYRFDHCHDITLISPGCEHASIANGGRHCAYITDSLAINIHTPMFDAGDDGINISTCQNVTVMGGALGSNGNNAITVSASSGVTLITPEIETPVGDGIWIGNVCSGVLIINPLYDGAPGGVQINDAAAIATTLRSGVLNLAATLRARGATVAVAAGEVGIGASTAAGAGAAAGVYWRINIGGTFYKIALLADA